MALLKYWLILVAALSILATILGTGNVDTIKATQFPGHPEEVSPFAGRLFGTWTLLASVVRLICAFHLNEKGIYRATLGTFFIALGFYTNEVFNKQTATIVTAGAPFFFATTSIIWMSLTYNQNLYGKDKKN